MKNVSELKRIVDETIGMVGVLAVDGDSGSIKYVTVTGVVLLEVHLEVGPKGGWGISGHSQAALSDALKPLYRIGL